MWAVVPAISRRHSGRRGTDCYLFEPDPAEMFSGGEAPPGAVLADGYWLPVADGSADICFTPTFWNTWPTPPV